MRLIDADELLRKEHQHYDYLADEWLVPVRDIEDATTIFSLEERKKGKWTGVATFECSVCHETSCCAGNYCMNCGADMRE